MADKFYICTTKCCCGKLFYPGDRISENEITLLCPDKEAWEAYFAPEGSGVAFEFTAEGKDRRVKLINQLVSLGKPVPPEDISLAEVTQLLQIAKGIPTPVDEANENPLG